MPHIQPLTLFELNTLVRTSIELTLPDTYWVEAELSEVRTVRGHCYMELVQKDLFSSTPVARASAKCWKSKWSSLQPKFERATGQPFHAGLQVLLLVSANFHEAYGFSWIVQDIDPTHTMGDMARKRLEIIRRLKNEGIFDLQKGLKIPLFAQRIAVISSANAAGYGDFCHQLKDNQYGFKFQTTLFPAIMQGQQVESSVISALDDIFNSPYRFDVVVIIRGGGATADLSGFDTLALAEYVANFPLPVITGIGHDRDESILDMVSNTRVKTPTAAAAFLTDHLTKVWQRIDRAGQLMANIARQRMETERSKIKGLSEHLPTLFSLVRLRHSARLEKLFDIIVHDVNRHRLNAQIRLDTLAANLASLTEKHLMSEHHRLEQLQTKIEWLSPEKILARGYSISLHNGKAVRNARTLKPGDEIVTRVQKGAFKSIVK